MNSQHKIVNISVYFCWRLFIFQIHRQSQFTAVMVEVCVVCVFVKHIYHVTCLNFLSSWDEQTPVQVSDSEHGRNVLLPKIQRESRITCVHLHGVEHGNLYSVNGSLTYSSQVNVVMVKICCGCVQHKAWATHIQFSPQTDNVNVSCFAYAQSSFSLCMLVLWTHQLYLTLKMCW